MKKHHVYVPQTTSLYNHGLILKIMAASDIGQIGHKKWHQNFTTLYSIPFLIVFHQIKTLHNFHQRGQHPTARHIIPGNDINALVNRK